MAHGSQQATHLKTNKTMSRLLLCFLLAGQIDTLAQVASDSLKNRDNYIINTTAYKKGIYKTFDEFKYNNPSGLDDFKFDGKNILVSDGKTGRLKKLKKREVWGFSDGSKIFVSWNKYNEILETGRYCYFKERGTRIAFGISAFPFMILPIPYPYKDEIIINYNTGKPFVLSKRLLKKILTSDDPELLKEFKNETSKRRKLFDYIVKYNDRNVSKIK